MKLRKRVFSWLMMLCMMLTLMPTTFYATETEGGTLNYVYKFAETDGTVISGMTVTLNYCNSEQEVTGGVTFMQSTEGSGVYQVTYSGDKFVYEGQEYSHIRMDFTLPEGYVINTLDGAQVTSAVSFTDVDALKNIQNAEVCTTVDKVSTDTGNTTETEILSFQYEMHEGILNDANDITAGYEVGNIVEGGSVEVYYSNAGTDGYPDHSTETVHITFSGSTGTIQVECKGDKFVYDGQEYTFVEVGFIRPEGYKDITGDGVSTPFFTVSSLKSYIDPYVYCMFIDDGSNESPIVDTTVYLDLLCPYYYLNLPCALDEATGMPNGMAPIEITVDETDIETGVLVTTLNELFAGEIPVAPTNQYTGKFLGWTENPNALVKTMDEYCLSADEEFELVISGVGGSRQTINLYPVYERKAEVFQITYIDEMGNQIIDKKYLAYVDFPMTYAQRDAMAENVTELFGLSHVQSFGKITATKKNNEYKDCLLSVNYNRPLVIEYSYENVRTDTTFEKSVATFSLKDGTIVNGVEATVRLCNGTNDANKVTIATANTGQVETIIEHAGDVIYYGGNTYDTIEFEYHFPEGYVLENKEDLTGATVWYTATEWCEGGGAYWVLEKTDTSKNDEVIIEIPNADAPAEEAVKVEIPTEQPVVSEDKMDVIIEANKKHPVKIETNDNVSIEFQAGGMKHVDGKHEYDFGVKVEKDYDKAHDKNSHGGQHVDEQRKFKEDEFVLRINYNYSGELPGEAEISIPVGKEWAGKRLYYYQLLEDGSYRYTGQNGIVDENGYFRVKQSHCSDYVVVTVAPETELVYPYPLYDNGVVDTVSYTSPKTGDSYMFISLLMIVTISIATTIIRQKVNN